MTKTYASLWNFEKKLYQFFLVYTTTYTCQYKQCYYYSWNSWSATCGQVTRTRRYYYSRSATKQVQYSSQCSQYKQTCENTESESKTLAACPSKFIIIIFFLNIWRDTISGWVGIHPRLIYLITLHPTKQNVQN